MRDQESQKYWPEHCDWFIPVSQFGVLVQAWMPLRLPVLFGKCTAVPPYSGFCAKLSVNFLKCDIFGLVSSLESPTYSFQSESCKWNHGNNHENLKLKIEAEKVT